MSTLRDLPCRHSNPISFSSEDLYPFQCAVKKYEKADTIFYFIVDTLV